MRSAIIYKNGPRVPLSFAVPALLASRQQKIELFGQQIEVLQLLVKGCRNKEIAAALGLSEDTIKSHLKVLFAKLGVRSRVEAVIAAIRNGIVQIE